MNNNFKALYAISPKMVLPYSVRCEAGPHPMGNGTNEIPANAVWACVYGVEAGGPCSEAGEATALLLSETGATYNVAGACPFHTQSGQFIGYFPSFYEHELSKQGGIFGRYEPNPEYASLRLNAWLNSNEEAAYYKVLGAQVGRIEGKPVFAFSESQENLSRGLTPEQRKAYNEAWQHTSEHGFPQRARTGWLPMGSEIHG